MDVGQLELVQIRGLFAKDMAVNLRRQETGLVVQPGHGLRQPNRSAMENLYIFMSSQ